MHITHLQLFTSNLAQQRNFYSSLLNLDIIDEGEKSFSVNIGKTILCFEEGDVNGIYHFAINIPSYKIESALNWIAGKIEIQKFENKQIVNFPNWNAKSIYFYDHDGNIVELISRNNLNIISKSNFTKSDLLSISEIGLPTLNIAEVFKLLNEKSGLDKYDCDLERFCAIGDDNGLFIVIDYSKKKWIPNMDEAKPIPLNIDFNNGGESYHLEFKDEKINILNRF